ncbi:MAG: hypothetical protein ACK55Z_16200, partial [bacterium]
VFAFFSSRGGRYPSKRTHYFENSSWRENTFTFGIFLVHLVFFFFTFSFFWARRTEGTRIWCAAVSIER